MFILLLVAYRISMFFFYNCLYRLYTKLIITWFSLYISDVVCLPRPVEGMGQLQFSDLFTELPDSPQAAGVVGTF